ncbi:hypothetical protein TSUD_260210 [Trifolium subterraneum]|uniref:Mitochondrial carrier protein n=1 Tax=Trifolium subterraneum TaxID=3900 RepID=A0A2Z6N8S5_TRISU|nr:hypothetical protein TSUD_260210 [Trifolium subterraneum]
MQEAWLVAGEFNEIADVMGITTPRMIRKTLMVEGYNGMAKYKSGLQLATKIVKTDGVKGLYKGFGLPFIAYSPSNNIWWGTYNFSQHIFLNYTKIDNISWRKSVFYQAAGGFLAGGITCCFNHPFDTINTIIQVNHMKKQTIIKVVKELFKEDGFKAFFKGIGPRFAMFSITGAGYAFLCEYFKVGNLAEVPLEDKSLVKVEVDDKISS